ncbi:hypothetical protein EON65_38780 [archaeon]|nr:MAG: hypothetical protein EON65_38780 [archaeon]
MAESKDIARLTKFKQFMSTQSIIPWRDSISDALYVTDFGSNTVKLVDTSNNVKVLNIVSEVPLSGPFSISGPGDNVFYLTELTGNRVRHITVKGETLYVSIVAGSRNSECGMSGDGFSSLRALLCQPRGLFYHKQRNALYIADSGNYRVRIINLGDMYIDSVPAFASIFEYHSLENMLPVTTMYTPADVFVDTFDDTLFFIEGNKSSVYYWSSDSESFQPLIVYELCDVASSSNTTASFCIDSFVGFVDMYNDKTIGIIASSPVGYQLLELDLWAQESQGAAASRRLQKSSVIVDEESESDAPTIDPTYTPTAWSASNLTLDPAHQYFYANYFDGNSCSSPVIASTARLTDSCQYNAAKSAAAGYAVYTKYTCNEGRSSMSPSCVVIVVYPFISFFRICICSQLL